jgi:hypothetical protein
MESKVKKSEYYQKIKNTIRKKYLENGGKEKARQKRIDNKKKSVEFFNFCCADCGFKSEYYDVYDFHHIDPSTKEKEISDIMNRTWKIIETEIKKCIMLCANCHRIRHAKERE